MILLLLHFGIIVKIWFREERQNLLLLISSKAAGQGFESRSRNIPFFKQKFLNSPRVYYFRLFFSSSKGMSTHLISNHTVVQRVYLLSMNIFHRDFVFLRT